ncbi:30S ribosomal protein S5-like [Schistocerca gregaria]|uniref:30S ribosomal protein S5-like n=1 Tax=Schistocerca gregaria TaxID=7010 RepID=UPI00211ED00E|nr:30S ribosomal protein S5-like [Schistocerca gregaria]
MWRSLKLLSSRPRPNATTRPVSKKHPVLIAPFRTPTHHLRTFHATPTLNKRPPRIYKPLSKEEPDFVIDGDTIPQSRLGDMFAQLNENIDAADPIASPDHQKLLVNEVLSIGRHTKILPGGRLMTFSALVMVGTGNGCAGIGRARGETVSVAIRAAVTNAKKNMISINRHRGCTVSRDNVYKYKRTKVIVGARRMGYGIQASPDMRLALKAFGLKDLFVTTTGRTGNKQALYRALFKGLQRDINTPSNIAKALGKKLFDIHAFHYNSKD